MKVLSLVTNRYATFYQKQVEALSSLGVEITHISPRKQSPDYGVRQEISRSIFDYAEMYAAVLRESVRDYDLIHANNGKMAPFALIQPKRPVVLTFWGSDLMENYTTLCRKTAKYADAVVLPSNSMAPYLDADYTVIPFGVDTDIFGPMSQSKARKEVGWQQDKNIALFPYPKSRSVKNYPLAEQAVEEVEGLEIYQISGVNHEDVPLFMNASDCVLVTSKRESGPMVIKEAALCNVPVVSTDVGFAAEVLSDVENSYVCSSEVELRDRLEAVLESGGRSDGRKHADEWGLYKMGERLVDVYESVLEK